MGKSGNNISAEELWEGIQKMAAGLGFADCGCAHLAPLSGSREEKRYREAEQMGHFGKMEYLKRNVDKRMDPSLLLPDAKSVIVFLAPYSAESVTTQDGLRFSSYALGEDYHKVIKDKLYRIVSFIEETAGQKKKLSGHHNHCRGTPVFCQNGGKCLRTMHPLPGRLLPQSLV